MNAGAAARSDGFWGIGNGATLCAKAQMGRRRNATTLRATATPVRHSLPVIRRAACALVRIVPRRATTPFARDSSTTSGEERCGGAATTAVSTEIMVARVKHNDHALRLLASALSGFFGHLRLYGRLNHLAM
jgi:hypothetical protein